MTNDELWKEFEQSGRVSDYLKYAYEQGAEKSDEC